MNKEKFLKELKRTRSQAESLMYSLHYLLEETVYDARDYVDNELMKPIFDELDNQEQAVMNGEVSDSRRVKDSDENSIKAVIDEVLSDYFPDLTVEDYHIYGEREDGLLAEPEISGCDMYVFETEYDAKAYILNGYGVECVDGAMRDDEWVDYLISGGVEPDGAKDLIERQDWQGVVEVILNTAGAEWFLSSYSGEVFYNGGYAIYF